MAPPLTLNQCLDTLPLNQSPWIIVGGGAAGFMAAITAKANHPQQPVWILEATAQPLGKVKISGGGRCNVTHRFHDVASFVSHYPRGQKELKGLYHRFGPLETVQWFAQRGVALKTEDDGRMFPTTDSSQTVIDCLQAEAQRLGVALIPQCPVHQIEPTPNNGETAFQIHTKQGTIPASHLILATGGNPRLHSVLQSLGHTIVNPVPSLFTAHIADKALHELAGISVAKTALSWKPPKPFPKVAVEGPLLFTHWGLSGPAMLRLSAWGAPAMASVDYQATLTLNLLPDMTDEAIYEALLHQKSAIGDKQLANGCPFPEIAKRLWLYLLHRQQANPELTWRHVPDKVLRRLTEDLRRGAYAMSGQSAFKEEFVTAGGVDRREIDWSTIASKKVPGLFFAGELIDVDGLTGGFNFQNAWSTGFVAGSSLKNH